jgi:hypothetical protein
MSRFLVAGWVTVVPTFRAEDPQTRGPSTAKPSLDNAVRVCDMKVDARVIH